MLRQAAVERLEAQAHEAGLGPAAPASGGGRYVPLLARATEPALEERLLKAGRRRPGPPACGAAGQPQGRCDVRDTEPADGAPCTAACSAEVRGGEAGERGLCLDH